MKIHTPPSEPAFPVIRLKAGCVFYEYTRLPGELPPQRATVLNRTALIDPHEPQATALEHGPEKLAGVAFVGLAFRGRGLLDLLCTLDEWAEQRLPILLLLPPVPAQVLGEECRRYYYADRATGLMHAHDSMQEAILDMAAEHRNLVLDDEQEAVRRWVPTTLRRIVSTASRRLPAHAATGLLSA